MSAPYPIWEVFPPYAREAALRERYVRRPTRQRAVDDSGYCPLGRAFATWLHHLAAEERPRVEREPDESETAATLLRLLHHPLGMRWWEGQSLDTLRQESARFRELEAQAASFISDWDAGQITDLAAAVGLPVGPGGSVPP